MSSSTSSVWSNLRRVVTTILGASVAAAVRCPPFHHHRLSERFAGLRPTFERLAPPCHLDPSAGDVETRSLARIVAHASRRLPGCERLDVGRRRAA